MLAFTWREGYFTLDTDVSDKEIGCVLMQDQADEVKQLLGTCSRKINAAELNDDDTHGECKDTVWAIPLLRLYLEGQDSQSVQTMKALMDPEPRRLGRTNDR